MRFSELDQGTRFIFNGINYIKTEVICDRWGNEVVAVDMKSGSFLLADKIVPESVVIPVNVGYYVP